MGQVSLEPFSDNAPKNCLSDVVSDGSHLREAPTGPKSRGSNGIGPTWEKENGSSRTGSVSRRSASAAPATPWGRHAAARPPRTLSMITRRPSALRPSLAVRCTPPTVFGSCSRVVTLTSILVRITHTNDGICAYNHVCVQTLLYTWGLICQKISNALSSIPLCAHPRNGSAPSRGPSAEMFRSIPSLSAANWFCSPACRCARARQTCGIARLGAQSYKYYMSIMEASPPRKV